MNRPGYYTADSPQYIISFGEIQDPLQKRQDEIRKFFLGVAVGTQDEVVIAGIVAAYANVTADVVLTYSYTDYFLFTKRPIK